MPLARWSSFGYTTRLTAPDIGAIDLLSDSEQLARADDESPEMIAWCAQDVLEPFLRERAEALPTVSITTGVTATDIALHEDHVSVTTLPATGEASGPARTLTGRYLVGADGTRSTVRESLGIEAPRSPAMGHQINARFEADLSPYIGSRRHIIWWIINGDTTGAFLTYDGDRQWVFSWAYDPDREQLSDFTPERCAAFIRAAIGDIEADVRVDGVFPWTIDSAVAERFRQGRAFLVGDAAHRFPPSGGFGMNSGIQDAQNLAWKLAMVLRHGSGDELLESYDTERRAVARHNQEQTELNVLNSAKVGWVMWDPDILARIEGPDGVAARTQIAEAIPLQKDQYWSYGQQFGFVYQSSAVVPDGPPAEHSTVSDYRPTGAPGAHAPHVWLTEPDGMRRSTIDLLHSEFVLLTGPDRAPAWRDAVESVATARGITVDLQVIGPEQDLSGEPDDWAARYGIVSGGAVLVRPDGHVAFRARERPDDPAAALAAALERILSLDAPSETTGVPATDRSGPSVPA